MSDIPFICEVAGTPTHDGEASCVVVVEYPGGGRSKIHMSGKEAAAVVARAGVAGFDALIGQPWTVLQIRPVGFTG
jgi:hypothetical protein